MYIYIYMYIYIFIYSGLSQLLRIRVGKDFVERNRHRQTQFSVSRQTQSHAFKQVRALTSKAHGPHKNLGIICTQKSITHTHTHTYQRLLLILSALVIAALRRCGVSIKSLAPSETQGTHMHMLTSQTPSIYSPRVSVSSTTCTLSSASLPINRLRCATAGLWCAF
jgi:hypothetical protein